MVIQVDMQNLVYAPGNFGGAGFGSSRRRKSMYVPHLSRAKTPAARRNNFSIEPPKKTQILVF